MVSLSKIDQAYAALAAFGPGSITDREMAYLRSKESFGKTYSDKAKKQGYTKFPPLGTYSTLDVIAVTSAESNGSPYTHNIPAGAQSGDLALLFHLGNWGNVNVDAGSTGWSFVTTSGNSNIFGVSVLKKTLTGAGGSIQINSPQEWARHYMVIIRGWSSVNASNNSAHGNVDPWTGGTLAASAAGILISAGGTRDNHGPIGFTMNGASKTPQFIDNGSGTAAVLYYDTAWGGGAATPAFDPATAPANGSADAIVNVIQENSNAYSH